MAVSPDGALVAAGPWGRAVELLDARDGALRRALEKSTLNAQAIAFSLDGATVAAGGEDRVVRLWDVDGADPT